MKSLFFTVLTILAVLAPLANAQGVYISPWESGSAQYRAFRLADTLATCGGYCTPSPANPFGGYAGYGYPGVGYPGVGNGRVARRVVRDASAAATGAGFGYAIAGKKGAIAGGLLGVGAAELGDHLMSRRGGSAAAGPSAGSGQGDFELSNSTRFAVEAYHRNEKGKEKYVGRLSSGDTWAVKAPKPGEAYYGFALIPNNSGGLSSDRLVPTPTETGWEFREPDFVQGRRQ